MNPRITAYYTVDAIMDKGLAKGHAEDGWKSEPPAMHIQKAARHGLTCLLLLEHPEFCKDPETAAEHLEQMLTRAAIALSLLQEAGHAAG